MILRAFLAFLVLGTAPAQAALNAQERLDDFSQLVNTVERNYGALLYKEKTLHLDFPARVKAFRRKIARAGSDAEFYQLLTQFLAGFQDAHLESTIPSTLVSTLSFTTDLVEGKVLLDEIQRIRLPDAKFPFQKGDRLVAIDGVPVEQIMANLVATVNNGNSASAQRMAAAWLTSRSQASGFAVQPSGTAMVSVLPKGAAQPVTVPVDWTSTGDGLIPLDSLGFLTSEPAGELRHSSDPFEFARQLPLFNSSLPQGTIDSLQRAGVKDIGSSDPMFSLPDEAKILPGFSITAAIYPVAGKNIGILRVPSYQVPAALEDVTRALAELEKEADVLVLDQTNNPGGALELASALVGVFADKPYRDMNYQVRPSLRWIDDLNQLVATANQKLVEEPSNQPALMLKNRAEEIIQTMREALTQHQFLTHLMSISLTEDTATIRPAATHFSKPVLVLINEFDFSAGDVFPALMKDNGRATLFGARTAGAGGNVAQFGPLTNSYFKFKLTQSLMVRPNGEYMENRGVQPDVPYTVTEDDFLNGYRGYVKAFTVEALKLAGAAPDAIAAFRAQPQ